MIRRGKNLNPNARLDTQDIAACSGCAASTVYNHVKYGFLKPDPRTPPGSRGMFFIKKDIDCGSKDIDRELSIFLVDPIEPFLTTVTQILVESWRPGNIFISADTH